MRTFSKVLALALCVAMLFTTAFAAGLKASYVDFSQANGKVTARADLRNDTNGDLTGKIIVASYDANGNLIATGESAKAELASGAETIVSASVDATEGADYKAFLWNDAIIPNSVHAVKGALTNNDFTTDGGVSNGKKSAKVVSTQKASLTDGFLYTNLHGRDAADDSEETGGRLTTNNANSSQYHELYYVDESIQGYDYFVFQAGTPDYKDVTYTSGLLTFDVVRDSEIIILASNDKLELDGFECSATSSATDGFARGRYMSTEFGNALRTIGIRPTYSIAQACDAVKPATNSVCTRENDVFYNEYLKAAYEAATDSAKATFDTNWNTFRTPSDGIYGNAATNAAPYTCMYTATVTVPQGQDTASVHIPANTATYVNKKGETLYQSTRNFIVIVKPLKQYDVSGRFMPVAKAAELNAAPQLKAVMINDTKVDISEFTNDEYTYSLDLYGKDDVLPVVKGITEDNGIYSYTDYSIAQDQKTAVATITAKNLSAGTQKVYKVNIVIAPLSEPQTDLVSLGQATLVDDTNVFTGAVIHKGEPSDEAAFGDLIQKVRGMTYPQYINYVNEYNGTNIVGTGTYLPETNSNYSSYGVISTSTNFLWDNSFAVGDPIGNETKRRVTYVNPKFSYLLGAKRLSGYLGLSQGAGGTKAYLTGGLYFGVDAKNNEFGDGVTYNIKAKTDGLPAVPWFTVPVTASGTALVASYKAQPTLVAKGYNLVSSGEELYYGELSDNNSKVNGPTYLYLKEFTAGQTVEIFNENTGSSQSQHPASWFFINGTIDWVGNLSYGQKSSTAVATAYDSSVTDGVLYKNFSATTDRSDPYQTGSRWTSSQKPFLNGELYHRIDAIYDQSIVGADYFVFNNGSGINYTTGSTTNLLEFKVDEDCEVRILVPADDSSASFEGYSKTAKSVLKAVYPDIYVNLSIKAIGYPASKISIGMIEDFYGSSKLTWNQLYEKYLKAELSHKTSEELREAFNTFYATKESSVTAFFASGDSAGTKGGSGSKNYDYYHSKKYNANDTVIIPRPTGDTSFARSIIVVVIGLEVEKIKDHVTDFKTVAEGGEDIFHLGPENTTATSARLTHDYHTTEYISSAPPGSSPFSINGRIFGVTDEILGLEKCYYLKFINKQAAVDKIASGSAKALWAGGNGAADLPWMTFTVNKDCDIVIIPSSSNTAPNFVTKAGSDWHKTTLDEVPFTLKRHANSTFEKYSGLVKLEMYTKSYKAGDTVTLYNVNTGKAHSGSYNQLPYYAFVRVK